MECTRAWFLRSARLCCRSSRERMEMGCSYPFRIHEHWVIVLSDREDKNALDAVVLTPHEMVEELRAFPMIPDKEGMMTFHLHFLCPAYVGLDFTVPGEHASATGEREAEGWRSTRMIWSWTRRRV